MVPYGLKTWFIWEHKLNLYLFYFVNDLHDLASPEFICYHFGHKTALTCGRAVKGTRCLGSVELVFEKHLKLVVMKCKWLDR